MSALPEIVVDSFAGGGGASEGIEMAMRRMARLGLLPEGVAPIVDIAINHDAKALAMHAANHPRTVHMPCDIWTADPLSTANGRPVGLLWASPDCRHHSKAKGGRPVSESVRGLAWVVVNWLELVAPRVVCLENVEEFKDWGPLIADRHGDLRPDPNLRGATFRKWVSRCKALGYKVDWREMRASNHGAPTIRKRLFIIMRRDGEPIMWPPVSHGDPESEHVQSGLLKPWRTAAEIIEWERPCPSILMSKHEAKAYTAATGTRLIRPLAENTERRVARGIKRYVIDAAKPFIVTCNHAGVAAYLAQHNTDVIGRDARKPVSTMVGRGSTQGLVAAHMMTMRNAGKPFTAADEPMHTVTAGGAGLGVVAAHMVSLKGSTRRAYDARDPHATVTADGQHSAVVRLPLFTTYYGSDEHGAGMAAPMRTISTRDRFGLVDCPAGSFAAPMTEAQVDSARAVAAFLRKYDCWDGGAFVTVEVDGRTLVIVDIGMRMLTPRELARAQGFGDDYILVAPFTDPKTGREKHLTDTDQRHKIGNSVVPQMADAVVFANYRPQLRQVEKSEQAWLLDVPMEAAE